MRDFDVQAIEIAGPFQGAFRSVADPRTLPEWTHAFRSVSGGRVMLATPKGSVGVGLEEGVAGVGYRRLEPSRDRRRVLGRWRLSPARDLGR